MEKATPVKPSKIPPHSPPRSVGQTKWEKTNGLEEEEKRREVEREETHDNRMCPFRLRFSTMLLYICDTFDIFTSDFLRMVAFHISDN